MYSHLWYSKHSSASWGLKRIEDLNSISHHVSNLGVWGFPRFIAVWLKGMVGNFVCFSSKNLLHLTSVFEDTGAHIYLNLEVSGYQTLSSLSWYYFVRFHWIKTSRQQTYSAYATSGGLYSSLCRTSESNFPLYGTTSTSRTLNT